MGGNNNTTQINTQQLIPISEKYKYLFPDIRNYKKLQITRVGLYSIAKPHIADKLLEFLNNEYGNLKHAVITETHGGMGGFSMKLLGRCKLLNIIEIDPIHANIIKNNLNVIADEYAVVPNFKLFNCDVMDYFKNKPKSDIIVCDPPWGGPTYIKKDKMMLYIGDVTIADVINELYKNNMFKMFVLMCMRNFDYDEFVADLKVGTSRIVRCEIPNNKGMASHYFVGIIKK